MNVTSSKLETGITIEDMSNGNGYWSFMPNEATSQSPEQTLSYYGELRFEEMGDIVSAIKSERSVLITGEPGCGKTNLIKDVEKYCVINSIPALRLSMHINAGKRASVKHTKNLIQNFSEANEGQTSLLVVDNVDYFAYKSRGRSQTRALEYAQELVPALITAMKGSGTLTLGTAHTLNWQENHWQPNNDEIKKQQEIILNSFESKIPFEGRVGLSGINRVIEARLGKENPQCQSVIDKLVELGVKSFQIVKHVDPDLLQKNPEEAIKAVEEGRKKQMRIKLAN